MKLLIQLFRIKLKHKTANSRDAKNNYSNNCGTFSYNKTSSFHCTFLPRFSTVMKKKQQIFGSKYIPLNSSGYHRTLTEIWWH